MITDKKEKLNLASTILLLSALVIQSFSFSLSFYDGLVDGGVIQIILNYIYTYRDVCLISSLGILLFYRAFPKDSVLLVLFVLLTILFTAAIYPDNIKYFQQVQTQFVLCVDSYLIIRSGLINIELFKKVLRWFCIVLSFLAIYTFFTQQATLLFIEQYMDYSNAVSIVSALLLYFGLVECKKIDTVLGFITYIILFIAGGRGAFITLSLLIVSLLWLKYNDKKYIYVVFCLCIVLLVFPNLILDIILAISSSLDFESRTIERLLSGDLLRGNDRYQLYSYLWGIIKDNPFWGGGICADRYYLDIGHLTDNGYYAHNIIVEMVTDFGMFGLVFLIFVIYQIYRFVKKYHKNRGICGFVIVYVIVSFVQLLFSRSWLTEPNFFILIGLLIYYNNTSYDYKTQS